MKRVFPSCSVTAFPILLAACGSDPVAPPPGPDAGPDVKDASVAMGPEFCTAPGSVVFQGGMATTIPAPAGKTEPSLSFLKLPDGFCVHYFATVPAARTIRFAPGGELFVSSPSQSTAGGAPVGTGAVMAIPDDDGDGYGDTAITFQDNLPEAHGMLFANSAFYYQDQTKIMRVPYTSGTRVNKATPTQMVDIQVWVSSGHWPKTLDKADDGTIYVTNGSDQGESCVSPHVFKGGILSIDGSPGGKEIAHGFRNPIYLRCQRGHDNCFVNELTRDVSASIGGREKLVLFGPGQDWGYPCCASQNYPFPDIMPTPDCSGVMPDTDLFVVGNTPFGLDFETGAWPAPYTNNVFIAMHGSAGSWSGARYVTVRTDSASGKPLPGSNIDGGTTGALSDFMTGYDDGTNSHGRPSDVTFAADGRMFVADDNAGVILWVAPVGLKRP